MAAMIALVNNARSLAGKPPLGFVTPLIYSLAKSNPEVFNNVVGGTNNCCAGSDDKVCCKHGFEASAHGWDPLTGLGSIDYNAFLDAAMKVGSFSIDNDDHYLLVEQI